MIPAYETIEGAYSFLAARYGFTLGLTESGVRAALDEAKALATAQRDEPAALFFALARRLRALGGAWRVLSALVALNHAAGLGVAGEHPRDRRRRCDGFSDVAFTGADRALYWGGPDGLRAT